ncbi:hypothetical protein CBS76997_4576 [Aspergillus niger]|nr:hypothetical protein CBS76997_4576 [Aspergillus niger]
MDDQTSNATVIAKQHIDSISAQYRGILENSTAQSIIDSALQFFGEDIYSTAAHFLLELIQNADDNEYAANITPALVLTYRNRVLRTDCNELGFTPGQVEAICNLGYSTKKDKVEATGEKGVGFKSVFSVAASVWIASGPYTFKFDASNQMGMLIPIWESPPDATRYANTSMYARFAPRADERIVFHDLDVVGAKILTFLRKLRELNLHIELQSGDRICYNVARQDTTSPDGLCMTQLTFTGEMFPVAQRKTYVVCRYEVKEMPQERKRPGRQTTELRIAFPVDDFGQPVLESQDVYAVLPVRSYGFTGYNPAIVCDLIVERQTARSRGWQNSQVYQRRLAASRVPELANQLYFLFKNKWTGDGERSLWVLNERSEPCPASIVYIPSKEPDSAAALLHGKSPKIELLHKDYLGVGGGDRFDFMEWLRSTFGIWRIPRLATPGNALSPDFQHLIDNSTSSTSWLLLLNKHFDQYSDWLVPGGWKSAKVSSSLRTTMVDCLHGERYLLEETCRPGLEKLLPRKALLLDPEFDNWKLLSHLGVMVGMDLKFYFSRLAELKETEASLEQISQIYTDIEAKSQDSSGLIRSTFTNDALICVPNPRSKNGFSWLQPNDCIWKGPKSLKHTPKLQELYPDNEVLFKKILKLRNAGAELLLKEIEEFKPENPTHILEVLQDANVLLKDTDPFSLALIQRMKIFPVRLPYQRDGFTLMTTSQSWSIPDERQRRYFGQDLPLLVFNYDAFDDMKNIRRVFDLGNRKLVATREVFCEDKNPRLLEPTTAKFLTRIKLMSRLIARDTPNIRKKVERLFTAQLFSVNEIFWALTVRHADQVITRGKGIAECLLADNEEEPLKIWVSKNCIKYDMFPSELADILCQLYKISERALAQDTLTQPPGYVAEKLTNSGYTADMEHELPPTLRDGWGKEKPWARINVQMASEAGESSHKPVRPPVELPAQPISTSVTSNRKLPVSKTHDRQKHNEENQKTMLLLSAQPTTEADNREGLVGHRTEPSSGDGTSSATENIPELTTETPAPQAKNSHARYDDDDDDDDKARKATADELIDGSDMLREAKPSVPTEMDRSENSGSQDHSMPKTHTRQSDQKQTSKSVADRTWLVYLKQELPPEVETITIEGGISTDDIASVYRQVIYVAQEIYDLNIPKPERKESYGVSKRPPLVEELSIPIRQTDYSPPREGVQLSLPHADKNVPSQAILKQRRRNEVLFHAEQKQGNQTPQLLKPRANGQMSSPAVSRDRKGATVIQIPGFPQHLLRDFLHNRTDTPSLSLSSFQPTGHYKFHALESLRHIRVLRLCGQENDLVLRGDILHVSLDESPSFIALSYTWGSALKPFSMQTPEGDIPLTASLYYALSRIQRTDGSINIWADGISINQSDATEKSQQISLLPTIYRQATQVYGWVGDGANDSSLALKSLQDIHASPLMVSRLGKRAWAAIIELFARAWFVRAWIIQEVILARDLQIVCGAEKLPWETLYGAVQTCEKYAETSVKNLKIPATRNLQPILSLGETRKKYHENQKRELLDLFELFQHAKSTLKRDKLFTLLNIAADAEGFSTDYRSPLETVMCSYASVFVARGKALELLSRARGVSSSHHFPSWIPDWTTNRYPKTICSWPSDRRFDAGGGGIATSRVDPENPAILEVAGSVIDTIVKVGSRPSTIDKSMEYMSEVLEFIDSSKSDFPNDDEKEDLEFTIPIGDAAHGPWGDRQGLKRSFQLLGQTLNRTKAPQSPVLVNVDTLREDLWLYCLTAVQFSERFGSAVVCQTARGYLGLVPAGAKAGDSLALISGEKVPFCLRHELEDYQVVGEAYIYGVMHGEAFKPEDVKTLRLS